MNLKPTLRKHLAVSAGGFLGAVGRYWLGGFFSGPAGSLPYGTLLINLSGSFGLGLFLTLLGLRYPRLPVEWRLFFGTGLVGSYTTFSTFSVEVLTLIRQGSTLTALVYSASSLVGGLGLAWMGYRVARWLAAARPAEASEVSEEENLAE